MPEVTITLAPDLTLKGDLNVPQAARGIVAFAHGSGSSHLSPRNRAVAQALADVGFATLLFDLLTFNEEVHRANVFDIPLLASRLIAASTWIEGNDEIAGLPLAYFGASTGSAAALTAAAEQGERVSAVISRGGRPDLALNLGAVRAPTLLIVGGADYEVLELNREAQRQLRCPSELPSCQALPICSKSRAPWSRSRALRSTGWGATSPRHTRPSGLLQAVDERSALIVWLGFISRHLTSGRSALDERLEMCRQDRHDIIDLPR